MFNGSACDTLLQGSMSVSEPNSPFKEAAISSFTLGILYSYSGIHLYYKLPFMPARLFTKISIEYRKYCCGG